MAKGDAKKAKVIASSYNPCMNLCDEGITLLAEGILDVAVRDYKLCWALKKLKNGGDWIFVWRGHKKKKKNEKNLTNKGSMYGLKGTVDDNIRQIEEYIRRHPLVGHLSEKIIKCLREEALSDSEILEKVKEIA